VTWLCRQYLNCFKAVQPGTIIQSDQWRAYSSIQEQPNCRVDDDEAAMSIHRSLKFAMSLGKKDLLEKIKENQDLVQLLQEQGPLRTKTIEDSCVSIKLLIKVVIHSYLQWSLSLVDPVLEVVGPGLGFL
jgi:hypothetical protein